MSDVGLPDIQASIEKLRESLNALPEHLRSRWQSFLEQVYVEYNGNDHIFMWASEPLQPHLTTVAAHTALMASPHVSEKLIELLESLNRYWIAGFASDRAVHNRAYEQLLQATHALTEAINRA